MVFACHFSVWWMLRGWFMISFVINANIRYKIIEWKVFFKPCVCTVAILFTRCKHKPLFCWKTMAFTGLWSVFRTGDPLLGNRAKGLFISRWKWCGVYLTSEHFKALIIFSFLISLLLFLDVEVLFSCCSYINYWAQGLVILLLISTNSNI